MKEKFECLVDNIIRYENIVFECLEGDKSYPPEIAEMIEKSWESRPQDEKYFYDGTVYSMIEYSFINPILKCKVQKTSFKAFYGSNIKNNEKIVNKSILANAIAACVVIYSNDGYILVGKRSQKVAEDNEYWHVIGGTMEGVEFKDERVPENPYDLIKKEILEEVSITPNDIEDLHCIGFGLSKHNHKYEFLFECKTNLTRHDLLEKAKSTRDVIDEHSEFRTLQFNEILKFIEKHQFSPIGELAIQVSLNALNIDRLLD
jgi:hypothetical protein